MKSVLISIQPKWCELIASGKKTVEVRKTKPKSEAPFKCYIYQTKMRWLYNLLRKMELHNLAWRLLQGLGKVIGEFVCDEITEFDGEFWDDETHEHIRKVIHKEDWDGYPEIETYYVAEDGEENYLCEQSCLPWEELRNYMGAGINTFYGWHISDLVIYDKPKELSEFYRECEYEKDCGSCPYLYVENTPSCYETWCEVDGKIPLKRPPQSWCYVEELKGE